MNVKEVRLRSYVHHAIHSDWGRGVVIKAKNTDRLGYNSPARFFVKWECDGKATWCRASELRKRPRKAAKQPPLIPIPPEASDALRFNKWDILRRNGVDYVG